jgi:hypothetical protein
VTDLQDMILDRLVGVKVGVNWPDGPLAIAAEVVGPGPVKFEAKSFDGNRKAKQAISDRLGLPVVLLEAIQGGTRGLANAEHRRSYAMMLFRSLSIGKRVKRMKPDFIGRVAVMLATRAHPFVCGNSGCEFLAVLAGLLDSKSLAGSQISLLISWCPSYGMSLATSRIRLTASTPVLTRAMYAAERGAMGLINQDVLQALDAAREATRVIATVCGVAPAVAAVLDAARWCGMATESV